MKRKYTLLIGGLWTNQATTYVREMTATQPYSLEEIVSRLKSNGVDASVCERPL